MTINIDPILPIFVEFAFIVLVISILLRLSKQPHVIGYILAGIIIGPHGLGLITDEVLLSSLGAIGVVLLLFFIGMEVSLTRLISKWRVAVLGTLIQILVSIGVIWIIGYRLDWPYQRIILLGFVISLSSTAVVLKILQDWRELKTKVGENVLSILLVQDIAIVPMLIILSLLGGKSISKFELGLQLFGGLAIVIFMIWLIAKDSFKLPFGNVIKKDHETQVFAALLICFGLALITAFFGLSAALGAFIAGIIVSAAKETHWVHTSLHSFYIIFVALFFVSIGMLIDLNFLAEHLGIIITLVLAVFITNMFINAIILKLLGDNWKESFYSGALLSQIGEFSFILALVGLEIGIITQFGYQATIAVISITLLLSPIWIMLMKKFTHINLRI